MKEITLRVTPDGRKARAIDQLFRCAGGSVKTVALAGFMGAPRVANVSEQIPIAEGLFTWPSNDPRLLGSRCHDCGVVTFPAQSGCPACCGEGTETIELERRGKLWTWTVQGFLPNRPPYDGPETPETFKPFGVGYVELPNQVRVETRIKTTDVDKLAIGMELELVVEPYTRRDGKDVVAYFFQPVEERL